MAAIQVAIPILSATEKTGNIIKIAIYSILELREVLFRIYDVIIKYALLIRFLLVYLINVKPIKTLLFEFKLKSVIFSIQIESQLLFVIADPANR